MSVESDLKKDGIIVIKKFDSENKRIEKCEERLDDHDNKIYALNSAVQAY